MNTDFHYRDKIRIGVIGAETALGQTYLRLLEGHPWFTVVEKFANASMADEFPKDPFDLVLSSLDEQDFAQEQALVAKGFTVISAFNNSQDTLIIAPEVNSGHLGFLQDVAGKKGCRISLAANSVSMLSLAIMPLIHEYGLYEVNCAALDPRQPAHESEGDVDLEFQARRLLGHRQQTVFEDWNGRVVIKSTATAFSDSETLLVFCKCKHKGTEADIIDTWSKYRTILQEMKLPFSPAQPIVYGILPVEPAAKEVMPLLISDLAYTSNEYTFKVSVGSVRERVAVAGIQTAELLVKFGLIYW